MSLMTSDVAESLATKLTPKFVAAVEADRAAVLAKVGRARRVALGLVWPILIALLPTLLRFAVDLLMERFGGMSLDDLLSTIVRHRASVRARRYDEI